MQFLLWHSSNDEVVWGLVKKCVTLAERSWVSRALPLLKSLSQVDPWQHCQGNPPLTDMPLVEWISTSVEDKFEADFMPINRNHKYL